MNILLVDDDQSMQKLYSNAFELEGYAVHVCEDGAKMFEYLEENSLPDLILLDIMMPNMNGIQALEKLKTDEQYAGVPVVVLTNIGGKSDEKLALQKGAEEFLVKSEHEPTDVVDIITGIMVQRSQGE